MDLCIDFPHLWIYSINAINKQEGSSRVNRSRQNRITRYLADHWLDLVTLIVSVAVLIGTLISKCG